MYLGDCQKLNREHDITPNHIVRPRKFMMVAIVSRWCNTRRSTLAVTSRGAGVLGSPSSQWANATFPARESKSSRRSPNLLCLLVLLSDCARYLKPEGTWSEAHLTSPHGLLYSSFSFGSPGKSYITTVSHWGLGAKSSRAALLPEGGENVPRFLACSRCLHSCSVIAVYDPFSGIVDSEAAKMRAECVKHLGAIAGPQRKERSRRI